MKILVTGASGFIGGAVVDKLAKSDNYRIEASGRSACTRFDSLENVRYRQLDLSEALPELDCDVCIHVAGMATDQASESELNRHNIYATRNLIASLKGCSCFIFISSASVYDFSDGLYKTEEDASPEKNLSAYGRSKLLAEEVVRESGFPSVYILRPRAVYGPGDRVLLPRILKLLSKKRMLIPGSLRCKSSVTHIANLVQAVELCLHQNKSGQHIFNIADSETYEMREVFAEIAYRHAGHRNLVSIPICLIHFLIWTTQRLGIKTVLSKQSVDYLNQNSVLSTDKIQKELNYRPAHSFYLHFWRFDTIRQV